MRKSDDTKSTGSSGRSSPGGGPTRSSKRFEKHPSDATHQLGLFVGVVVPAIPHHLHECIRNRRAERLGITDRSSTICVSHEDQSWGFGALVVIPLDDSYPMDDIGIWRRRATDAPRQSDALKTKRLCSRCDDAPRKHTIGDPRSTRNAFGNPPESILDLFETRPRVRETPRSGGE